MLTHHLTKIFTDTQKLIFIRAPFIDLYIIFDIYQLSYREGDTHPSGVELDWHDHLSLNLGVTHSWLGQHSTALVFSLDRNNFSDCQHQTRPLFD